MDNTFERILGKIFEADIIIIINLVIVFLVCFLYKVIFGKDE